MVFMFRFFIITIVFILPATISYSATELNKYQQSSEAGYVYELIIEEKSPDVMKPLPVNLFVRDSHGGPVTGAQIACELTMPAMAMPNNRPLLKESSTPGRYEGVFLLTMGGLWNAEMITTFSSGAQETVVIPIQGIIPSGDKDDINVKLESLFQEGKASSK